MSAWAFRIAIGAVAVAPLLGACTMETAGSVSTTGGAGSYGGTGSSGAGTSGGSSSSGASAQPMLVDVDPNLTLHARAGEGAGVFTEYASGGHWHVWWTCDTNQSGYSCPFDVAISTASGAIGSVNGQGLDARDQISQSSPTHIEVTTLTSTAVAGVTFDAPGGAIITVDARLNGVDDGSLMFFVQAGVLNGGYTGALTDPLMFEPSSP